MTELYDLLKSLGIPVAYDHFDEETECPFIVYLEQGKSTFPADNRIYYKKRNFRIELYTDEKDWDLEERLEKLLEESDLIWSDDGSVWIPSERMYQHIYFIEF